MKISKDVWAFMQKHLGYTDEEISYSGRIPEMKT